MERVSAGVGDALSPLVEVERAVQERAKAKSLDMADPSGIGRLRTLIEDEVQRWSDDHKRGLRPYDLADPELVVERAFRNLAGYGPLQPLLDDDNVWEIMINAPSCSSRSTRSGSADPRALGRLCFSLSFMLFYAVPCW